MRSGTNMMTVLPLIHVMLCVCVVHPTTPFVYGKRGLWQKNKVFVKTKIRRNDQTKKIKKLNKRKSKKIKIDMTRQ